MHHTFSLERFETSCSFSATADVTVADKMKSRICILTLQGHFILATLLIYRYTAPISDIYTVLADFLYIHESKAKYNIRNTSQQQQLLSID